MELWGFPGKKPRHPETVSTTTCNLYRNTRLGKGGCVQEFVFQWVIVVALAPVHKFLLLGVLTLLFVSVPYIEFAIRSVPCTCLSLV